MAALHPGFSDVRCHRADVVARSVDVPALIRHRPKGAAAAMGKARAIYTMNIKAPGNARRFAVQP